MASCWLCGDYAVIATPTRTVSRLIFEDLYTFVVVPKDSHVLHHVIVALKDHKPGLIDCSAEDNARIGRTIALSSNVLKEMGYSHIYAGCYSDEGHVHYHLIPFRMGIDKLYHGHAMHWLAEKERFTDSFLFESLPNKQQDLRLDRIEKVVTEILTKWQSTLSEVQL